MDITHKDNIYYHPFIFSGYLGKYKFYRCAKHITGSDARSAKGAAAERQQGALLPKLQASRPVSKNNEWIIISKSRFKRTVFLTKECQSQSKLII